MKGVLSGLENALADNQKLLEGVLVQIYSNQRESAEEISLGVVLVGPNIV